MIPSCGLVPRGKRGVWHSGMGLCSLCKQIWSTVHTENDATRRRATGNMSDLRSFRLYSCIYSGLNVLLSWLFHNFVAALSRANRIERKRSPIMEAILQFSGVGTVDAQVPALDFSNLQRSRMFRNCYRKSFFCSTLLAAVER